MPTGPIHGPGENDEVSSVNIAEVGQNYVTGSLFSSPTQSNTKRLTFLASDVIVGLVVYCLSVTNSFLRHL